MGITSPLTAEIIKDLSTYLSKTSTDFSLEFINQLIREIKSYLSSLEQIMNRFQNNLQHFPILDDENITLEFRRYLVAKQMIKAEPEIEYLLKQGYLLIDQLREAFTGEHLRYYVGVTVGRQHTLHEGFLDLDQVLSMVSATAIYRNSTNSVFKLRFNVHKSDLVRSLKTVVSNESKETLWSHIDEYSTHYHRNKGNLFEAYRVMSQQQGSNHIPPAVWNQQEFEDILLEVQKNTASFVKGGDSLDESIKFFGGAMPSLADLSTIRKALNSILDALSTVNIASLKSQLSLIFEKDSNLQAAFSEIINGTEEQYTELVSNIVKQ